MLLLEEFFKIIPVNARHIKNVPGHKTDKKDSEWIAKLLMSGLLKGSFVPPQHIRELRVLHRHVVPPGLEPVPIAIGTLIMSNYLTTSLSFPDNVLNSQYT
ncbi:MAG TPA: transposase, partial [Niabella sp.]|nr:transposase [Niabella sp.]